MKATTAGVVTLKSTTHLGGVDIHLGGAPASISGQVTGGGTTGATLTLELPGADLSHEELAVEVKPKQEDEFTCMSCFLVHHRSQLANSKNGQLICRDCAA